MSGDGVTAPFLPRGGGGIEVADEECATWEPPTGSPASNVAAASTLLFGNEPKNDERRSDAAGVWTSFFTVLISVPALVGSWCWPLLIAGLMGVATSEASKQLAHSVSFGITLAILTNVTQMVYWKSLNRRGTYWHRNGPTVVCALSIPFVMLDLTRHVLQDGKIWVDSAMYRPNCPHADVRCLSGVGASCVISTYVGFACLIYGVLWSANIGTKLRESWRRARQG